MSLFPSLRGYRTGWLRADLIAGFTVWAVLIPEALAYASIAGLSPVIGLYAAPAALVFYAMFGSSRHLIVGPMSATAALSASIVTDLVGKDHGKVVAMSAGLAVVAGVVALAAGALRLGFLASFISEPVLKGFVIGLALTIMIGQVPKLFGVGKGSGDFFEKLWDLVRGLGTTSWPTLGVGAASLGLLILMKRFAPRLPGALIVVLLGIGAVALFGLDRHGVDVVGPIARGLPHVGLPKVGLSDYLSLVGGGLGIVLIGFAEGLGAAKTYAAKAGYPIDPNRELLGLGAANAGAGLTSGMVVNGSLSKTAVNGSAGARSQLSGLMVAALTILTLLFLTGLFQKLPEATLGAVVIVAVVELIDIQALRELFGVWTRRLGTIYGRAARTDFVAALGALVGVLVFDTLPGLVIGVVLSVLLLLYRASRPHVAELGRGVGGEWVDRARHPDAERVGGVVVVRVESGLFFANADRVHDTLVDFAGRSGVRAIVLDTETVPVVDVTAARMLGRLAGDLAHRDVRLYLARDIGQVRDVLRHTDEPDADLLRRVYPSVDAAVEAATSS